MSFGSRPSRRSNSALASFSNFARLSSVATYVVEPDSRNGLFSASMPPLKNTAILASLVLDLPFLPFLPFVFDVCLPLSATPVPSAMP